MHNNGNERTCCAGVHEEKRQSRQTRELQIVIFHGMRVANGQEERPDLVCGAVLVNPARASGHSIFSTVVHVACTMRRHQVLVPVPVSTLQPRKPGPLALRVFLVYWIVVFILASPTQLPRVVLGYDIKQANSLGDFDIFSFLVAILVWCPGNVGLEPSLKTGIENRGTFTTGKSRSINKERKPRR
jgi:hypothetical protein